MVLGLDTRLITDLDTFLDPTLDDITVFVGSHVDCEVEEGDGMSMNFGG